MFENTDEIKRVLSKFKDDKCTEEEIRLIKKWWLHYDTDEAHKITGIEQQSLEKDLDLVWQQLDADYMNRRRPRRLLQFATVAAAALLILVGIGIYIQRGHLLVREVVQEEGQYLPAEQRHDVAPGGHRATLKTPEGTEIHLAENRAGIVITDAINYMDGQSLVHTPSSNSLAPNALYELVTPQGGTYRLQLADGTAVWLNAGSRLQYPLAFNGNTRTVLLEGEAFFEVSANPSQPFIVKTAQETVRVLGTKFNITAYPDDEISRTTLAEGKVEVVIDTDEGTVTRVLAPNQQSQVRGQTLTVVPVNAARATAWKDDVFRFHEDQITDIMKILSRWYAIGVVFEGEPTSEKFSGKISRHRNISQVLELLEKTDAVRFRIESDPITNERRVIVME